MLDWLKRGLNIQDIDVLIDKVADELIVTHPGAPNDMHIIPGLNVRDRAWARTRMAIYEELWRREDAETKPGRDLDRVLRNICGRS